MLKMITTKIIFYKQKNIVKKIREKVQITEIVSTLYEWMGQIIILIILQQYSKSNWVSRNMFDNYKSLHLIYYVPHLPYIQVIINFLFLLKTLSCVKLQIFGSCTVQLKKEAGASENFNYILSEMVIDASPQFLVSH